MKTKLCICSCEEAANTDYHNTINWIRKSDGSYETGRLQDEEIKGKVRCDCGEYMETHLHEYTRHDKDGNAYGKSQYEMIAVCSCKYPKPHIMIIDDDEYISMTQKELDERDHYNWVCGFNRRLKNESIHKHLDCIKDLI